MPNKSEIAQIAEQKGVTKAAIDKDWVLGHFVNAIYGHDYLRTELIFKGGTCLRKCFFPSYRFSENLDFTTRNRDLELSRKVLLELCALVETDTAVRLDIHSVKPLYFNNQLTGYQAEIKYWGAEHTKNQRPPDPSRWQTKIKIEVILFEKVVFETGLKNIIHPYSDSIKVRARPVCYDLHEVMSEKLRAMIQRSYTAPRDYYDVWYLSNNCVFDKVKIRAAFYEKMEFNGLKFNGIESFALARVQKVLIAHWHNSLGAHLPAVHLPAFETVLSDLQGLLREIFI